MTSRGVLHVTNGDSVVYGFRKAGIIGTYLPWRDALYEGPVPQGLSLEETSAVRAEYLARRGYGHPIKIRHELETRDATLHRAGEYDEVVLWFEHDLYDQLQLLQILDALQRIDVQLDRILLVQSNQYLGMLEPTELGALYPRRRFVGSEGFAEARSAWIAFTSSDPSKLGHVLADEFTALPYVPAALRRLCEEYPSVRDGLSRTQRQVLESVARGRADRSEIFRRAQALEDAAFLGDAAFLAVLTELAALPAPLIEGEEDHLTPTSLGRRTLGGDVDWLEHRPLDRFLGGVHLTSENCTRWDDVAGKFALPA